MTAAGLAQAMTVDGALRAAAVRLRAAGVASPALDARLLVAAALGTTIERVILWGDRELPAEAAERLGRLVDRRARREPMAQILGRREFWSLDFAVTRDTLTPRPETEEIVSAALERLAERAAQPLRILDLGCGSGCLLATLLTEFPAATGLGIDLSAAALAVARANAAALGLGQRAAFARGDWGSAIDGRFDLVVSNPPYVPSADIAGLEPEVRDHEPVLALDGGPDGLAAYRRLGPEVARLLRVGGVAIVECGAGQADDISAVFAAAGLAVGGRRRDLAGHERCLIVELAG